MINTTTNTVADAIVSEPSRPRYVGFIGRIAASAIDVFILMIGFGILQLFARGLVYIVANVAMSFLYYASSLTLKSRTLGQWTFGQITLTTNYERLSGNTAIKRAKWIIVSYLFFGLPMLTIGFSSKRQALHDLVAHTVVTYEGKKRTL